MDDRETMRRSLDWAGVAGNVLILAMFAGFVGSLIYGFVYLVFFR